MHWRIGANKPVMIPNLNLLPEFARLSPFARNATPSRTQSSTLSQTLTHTQNENTLADTSDPDHFKPHHELPPFGHETSQIQEGVIDIVSWSPFDCTDLYLDVTVRNCLFKDTAQSHNIDGYANIMAEQNKHKRYPTNGRKTITPCAIETWGRIGDSFLITFQHLSQQTSTLQHHRGFPTYKPLNKWLPDLSFILNRCLAKSVHDSLHRATPCPRTFWNPRNSINLESHNDTVPGNVENRICVPPPAPLPSLADPTQLANLTSTINLTALKFQNLLHSLQMTALQNHTIMPDLPLVPMPFNISTLQNQRDLPQFGHSPVRTSIPRPFTSDPTTQSNDPNDPNGLRAENSERAADELFLRS
jgi:hypothetical protein